jgi:hypothetical protein
MARAKSGGGANSSVVRQVGVRTGSRSADKISPRGVSEYGRAVGDKLTREGRHTARSSALPIIEGQKPQASQLGNAKALDVGKGGAGTGRTTYYSGYQGTHGAPVPDTTPKPGNWFVENYPGVPTAKGR